MNRHGVIVPREDGTKARCMGPGPCAECNKDMADLPRAELLAGLTEYFAQGWSKNEPLHKLVAMVFVCGQVSVAPEQYTEGGPVIMSVPMIGVIPELMLLGALIHLCDHFTDQLTPEQLQRASYYLADKYALRNAALESAE